MKIKKLFLNNCEIHLKNSESSFISESINNKSSLNKIKKTLLEMYFNSSVRYYSIEDIDKLAFNLKEEVGRNYHTPGSVSDLMISHEDVILKNKDNVKISPRICNNSGMSIVDIETDGKEVELKFNSDEEAQNFIVKLKTHNIN